MNTENLSKEELQKAIEDVQNVLEAIYEDGSMNRYRSFFEQLYEWRCSATRLAVLEREYTRFHMNAEEIYARFQKRCADLERQNAELQKFKKKAMQEMGAATLGGSRSIPPLPGNSYSSDAFSRKFRSDGGIDDLLKLADAIDKNQAEAQHQREKAERLKREAEEQRQREEEERLKREAEEQRQREEEERRQREAEEQRQREEEERRKREAEEQRKREEEARLSLSQEELRQQLREQKKKQRIDAQFKKDLQKRGF